jgi:hypothetical protein
MIGITMAKGPVKSRSSNQALNTARAEHTPRTFIRAKGSSRLICRGYITIDGDPPYGCEQLARTRVCGDGPFEITRTPKFRSPGRA